MADKTEEPVLTTINSGGSTIQTLNIVPQKVIQVNKPTEYYRDRKKTKMFIYQVYLY